MAKTTLGKWSVGLIVAAVVLLFLGRPLAQLVYRGSAGAATLADELKTRPLLLLDMLAGMACGVAAFVVGLWAIIKRHERSLMVYVSTGIGALMMAFLIGEFFGPAH